MLFIQFTPKSIFLFCLIFFFFGGGGGSLFCHFLIVFNLLFVESINQSIN